MKKLLHVGCGNNGREHTHHMFEGKGWEHVRIDINPDVKPDIIDDIKTLGSQENESADAIYSAHNLEHLHYNDAYMALQSWQRVLRPGGILMIRVPDMQIACEQIARGKGLSVMYVSPGGPIAAVDMVFGYRAYTKDNPFQRHLSGYTREILDTLLIDIGYESVQVRLNKEAYEVYGWARKAFAADRDNDRASGNTIEPAIRKLEDEVASLIGGDDRDRRFANALSVACAFLAGEEEIELGGELPLMYDNAIDALVARANALEESTEQDNLERAKAFYQAAVYLKTRDRSSL